MASSRLNWAEMVRSVQRLLDAEGSEAEQGALLAQLADALPGAGILDLIYHSAKSRSAEDIVSEAILAQNRTR
jgi:hypothetical protein